MPNGPPALRALRDDPPDAVVIDLGRLPSQGRDFGVALRTAKATRHVPLVFVGGDVDRVARVRAVLPDAVFASWDEIGAALERAIAAPPADPVTPKSVFAAYEGVPLARKLGMAKRSSGVESDLTQPVVRRAGLDRGLVDYKVVSVDETWTGLRFRPRRG